MFKFIFPAIMCIALCCPMVAAAQDCGCCEPDPCCVKTRKKLTCVTVQKEVCRLKRVCVTDECGCTKKKLMRVTECVSRKKLTRVEVPVDPCKKSCFSKLGSRFKGMCKKNDCCEPDPCCEPAPCCAPAACGCGCGY